MKNFALLLTCFFALSSMAQISNFTKAEKAFAGGNLKGANKLLDKCLEHKDTKNAPDVLLLKSKVMLAISKDPSLFDKYPAAIKDALKFAEKAVEVSKNKNNDHAFKMANFDYLYSLVRLSNKEAIESYNLKKYAKALPLFKRSMYFALDTQSMVLAADCYWNLDQKSEAVPLFKKSADMIYAAVLDSNSRLFGYHKEPFRKLCKYYMDLQAYDSAYVVVKNGREILPNDAILNDYTYVLMRYTLDQIPPSEDYLTAVERGLKDFPSDSFLNHRENSIYIFLLNGLATSNDQAQFDVLMDKYAKSKINKAKSKQLSNIQKFDIFAGMDWNTFLPKIRYYFKDLGLKEATYATWYYEVSYKFKERQAHFADQHETLDYNALLRAEKNIQCAEYLFERHIALNPKELKTIKTRADYISAANKTSTTYYDLLPLIHLNETAAKDFPKILEFSPMARTYRLRLIGEAADSGDFKLAREIWVQTRKQTNVNAAHFEMPKANADVLKLEDLWRKIVENDFKLNYFGSRVNPKGKNEAGVPEYAWNGYADSCMEGSMPAEVMQRAERRINYFRRMAGLSEEIVLTVQDNEYCMYAALMCEANRSMSHTPSEGWRCYIPAGFDALKNSILSKDGNPCIAVTAAMGQNHASVGNRRWLLYPKAQYMGIGTAKSYTAIKAVDQSRTVDTSKYKNQYIAWPPARECPRMLIFKKWSFSIDRNLEGATVSMHDQLRNNIPVKLEAINNGYGLNTLVWEPEINSSSIAAETILTVTVTLKDGKVWEYEVKVI
jgi:hypothetical protein